MASCWIIRREVEGQGRGGSSQRRMPSPGSERRTASRSPYTANEGLVKSYINVLFPFKYSQKWNCYFQNRIILFCLPFPKLIYLWEIYIFSGSVCLFCCRKICGPILEIYKSLTETWVSKLGLRLRNSQKRNTYVGFSLQCNGDGRKTGLSAPRSSPSLPEYVTSAAMKLKKPNFLGLITTVWLELPPVV
jgi:hypothetical protein